MEWDNIARIPKRLDKLYSINYGIITFGTKSQNTREGCWCKIPLLLLLFSFVYVQPNSMPDRRMFKTDPR